MEIRRRRRCQPLDWNTTQISQEARSIGDIGRLARFTGSRNGASVSISSRSSGIVAALACKSLAFLKVTMPEIETNSPSAKALSAKSWLAVKQWITPV